MIRAGSAHRSALRATAFAGSLRRKARAPRRFAQATTCAQGGQSNRGEAEDDKLPNLRRRLILGGLSGTLLNACPCCSQIGINLERPALADEWGYSAKDGPRTWGGTCAIGRQQSPINLPICPGATVPGPDGLGTEMDSDTLAGVAEFGLNADEPLPETELKFQYANDQPVMVKNNGHGSPQVDFSKENVLTVGDRKYQLRQYHFHTPSEHAFHGKRYVMEAHLVHQDINSEETFFKSRASSAAFPPLHRRWPPESGSNVLSELAVVGVMLKRGGTVPINGLRTALDTVRTVVRLREPFVPATVSPLSLIPTPPPSVQGGKHAYVHYQGSLTTPPCSEGVQWFVLSTPLEVTDAEVLDFAEFAGGRRGFGVNSRPLQSLGARYMELVGIL